MVKVLVLFYSLYGHSYDLAQAIAEGARQVEGAEVNVYQVPEVLSDEVIAKFGATEAKKRFASVPVLTRELQESVLTSSDVVFVGTGTRFGVQAAQMKFFFDGLGGLWFGDKLIGKVASAFAGSGSQHGGQETTLFSLITPLLHLGFIYVGLPYSCKEQMSLASVEGGTPYGVTYLAAGNGSRQVSDAEKKMAQFQGKHVTTVARDLVVGRAAHNK